MAKVARSGLPLDVSCNGGAHFLPAVDFIANTAGTSRQKGKLLKAARSRIIARHKRTRVLVTLAVEREDGYLWSEPKLNRRITLVR